NSPPFAIRRFARILRVGDCALQLHEECPQVPDRDLVDVGDALRLQVAAPASQLLLVPAHGVVRTLRPAIQQEALDGILSLHPSSHLCYVDHRSTRPTKSLPLFQVHGTRESSMTFDTDCSQIHYSRGKP